LGVCIAFEPAGYKSRTHSPLRTVPYLVFVSCSQPIWPPSVHGFPSRLVQSSVLADSYGRVRIVARGCGAVLLDPVTPPFRKTPIHTPPLTHALALPP
jgi:hypothetical protein